MKKKLLFAAIIGLVLHFNMFAQKGYAEKINQLNEKGQKVGLWKENRNKYERTEIYYHNGKKNGLYRVLNITNGELYFFGEYKNDTIIGTCYFFGDFGHLSMIQKDFKKNNKRIPIKGVQGILPYQCYCITYHPNGIKESEGILLWSEDSDGEFTFEYGEWKYYTDTGVLTKTKIFK
ncbi:MAG: hypothetical protein PHY71_00125 [Bacteroidaceae bacterium]|nr:hypothetical protein [Bacteroidaceae bacterium]